MRCSQVRFADWFESLRDPKAQYRIDLRLNRLQAGNFGDTRSVGAGVYELKIDYGPGYRVYFGQVGATIVLLLMGGDKSTQDQDIRHAIKYWNNYRN
ncbi:MAG: hypothetical protein RLZZ338_3770 [Cyanobacteriota bacterium]|jgi:putative addiction module killer protein